MRDVAARVGVSQTLVSLVFRHAPGASAETRERVLRAADELGYRPDTAARVLRRNRSRHIGVLFTMRQPFDVDLVEAVYRAAERRGYQVVLGALGVGRTDRQAVEELLAYRSEALILSGTTTRAEQLALAADQMPVVDIGRHFTEKVDVVRVADERGAGLAVDHLVGLGHRSIVHIDGGDLPAAARRRSGYRLAMTRHGLPGQIRIIPGDYTEESGASGARRILDDDGPLPTSVFAANDQCAHGVLDTLARAGVRVPDDISLVGYDDSDIARLSFIDLTTVRQDATQMAEHAVQAIIERLDHGRIQAREVVLDPTLVVRGTTGPPRAGK